MTNKTSRYPCIAMMIVSITIILGCTSTPINLPIKAGISTSPSIPAVLTAQPTPTEAPSTPIAMYFRQPSETPVTPIKGDTQASCEGKSYNVWGLEGRYLYKQTTDDGDVFLTKIPSFSANVPPGTNTMTKVVGIENRTI